ncbi:CYTH domain-containing protein [Barrientosiimonas marina]|uniref:CYTH domain-containing protein n=1 Tax=Lentibacillus kimchii TaxID=1542911 RepID=A0ABW2UR49_9BACI
MQEIEIEYKNLLIKEEFDRLFGGLAFPEYPDVQTNHYFETPDFALKDLGCALRIREKEQAFTLTLKEPSTDGLLETHDTLTPEEAHNWLNRAGTAGSSVIKRLTDKNISIEDLLYFGSMTTKRREFDDSSLVFVLDESTYHGITDYELEIEAASKTDGEQAISKTLEDFDIKKRATPNKIQRFFAAMPGR